MEGQPRALTEIGCGRTLRGTSTGRGKSDSPAPAGRQMAASVPGHGPQALTCPSRCKISNTMSGACDTQNAFLKDLALLPLTSMPHMASAGGMRPFPSLPGGCQVKPFPAPNSRSLLKGHIAQVKTRGPHSTHYVQAGSWAQPHFREGS